MFTPRVLKDGSDSVGVLGALNRVYLNIGLFSEEWLLHFNAVLGGKPITPIQIAVADRNSSYWQATEAGTPDMAQFFLKAGRPDYLKNAPGGGKYLTDDPAAVDRGKTVFAETCARCHSSKQPAKVVGLDPNGCAGPGLHVLLEQILGLDEDRRLQGADARHRACAGLPGWQLSVHRCARAGDAVADQRLQPAGDERDWPATSGTTSRRSPTSRCRRWARSPCTIRFTGAPKPYKMPAGGRGYTRPPSLVSVWSSAPYLLNNSVGPFNGDPSVDGRMKSFQASIEQMLWPEKRDKDAVLGDKIPGVIDRTTQRSWVTIPGGLPARLPEAAARHAAPHLARPGQRSRRHHHRADPGRHPDRSARQPAAAAGNATIRWTSPHRAPTWRSCWCASSSIIATLPKDATDEQLRAKFANLAAPMMALNKCPDFVVNRGHYFGTSMFAEEPSLSDSDKQALIAFLKTF